MEHETISLTYDTFFRVLSFLSRTHPTSPMIRTTFPQTLVIFAKFITGLLRLTSFEFSSGRVFFSYNKFLRFVDQSKRIKIKTKLAEFPFYSYTDYDSVLIAAFRTSTTLPRCGDPEKSEIFSVVLCVSRIYVFSTARWWYSWNVLFFFVSLSFLLYRGLRVCVRWELVVGCLDHWNTVLSVYIATDGSNFAPRWRMSSPTNGRRRSSPLTTIVIHRPSSSYRSRRRLRWTANDDGGSVLRSWTLDRLGVLYKFIS